MQKDFPFDIDKSKILDFKKRVDSCTIRKENLGFYYSQTEIDNLLMFKLQEQANYNQLAFKILPFLKYKQENVYNLNLEYPRNIQFTNIVQVGNSKKTLYAKFIHDSLRDCSVYTNKNYKVYFILNDDLISITNTISNLDIEKTLFIFENHNDSYAISNVCNIVKKIDPSSNKSELEKHFVYAENDKSNLSNSKDGFCILSPVSCMLNSIVYGKEVIKEILLGIKQVDEMSSDSDITQNFVMLSAMYNFFENNKKKKEVSLFIPYAQCLKLLPKVVQSLFMNLNCKNMNSNGEVSEIETESLAFGEVGSLAQKTLLQGLHKGTHLFSAEFIGFRDRKNLLDEMIYQSLLLFFGRKRENFYGGRCNTMLIFDKLNPISIGNIISYYENRAIFQNFLYNVEARENYDISLPKNFRDENPYINTILDFF